MTQLKTNYQPNPIDMENKYHIILQEPQNAQAMQGSPVNFFCLKCGKRWENVMIRQGEQIDTNGCPV